MDLSAHNNKFIVANMQGTGVIMVDVEWPQLRSYTKLSSHFYSDRWLMAIVC